MELKIGICDSDVGWHRRMEEILGKAECITRISREMEHFYGEKELLLYTGDSIDLLFMDVKLKDGNGITLAGQINGIWPECRIIFVAEDLSSAVDAYETDHAYYILKDQAADIIERVLDKALDRAISGRYRKSKKLLLSIIRGEQVLLAANEIIYFERAQACDRRSDDRRDIRGAGSSGCAGKGALSGRICPLPYELYRISSGSTGSRGEFLSDAGRQLGAVS